MERLPLDRSVLDSALERMDIADIAQATIRQSGDIARILENETETEFLHLEMGDRKSTRLNSSHIEESRMPSSA